MRFARVAWDVVGVMVGVDVVLNSHPVGVALATLSGFALGYEFCEWAHEEPTA